MEIIYLYVFDYIIFLWYNQEKYRKGREKLSGDYRIERDYVGEMEISKSAYYGIQTKRAQENFNITGTTLSAAFVKSLALIKKAAAIANLGAGELSEEKANAISIAADKICSGKYLSDFIVDPIQGGAGTSANMNINEVLANMAIDYMGGEKGDYTIVSPNDDVNCGQSTNDVIPTAGKLTVLSICRPLLSELDNLHKALLDKAEEFDDVITMGRTQLQDAVPMRMGQSFNAFATAINRDMERIKCALDEMRVVNMGATAIGTALNANHEYLETIVDILSEVSGEKLVRAKDLFDATQNVDSFASVSGTLKTLAINLSKMCNDLRLMSSGPRTGFAEIELPARQNGSSIMPGKVNPVIPEVVNQVSFLVIGHDQTITMAAEAGQFELNAFEPVIFHQLFESITSLCGAVKTLRLNCIEGIRVNRENCEKYVNKSVGIVTALNPYIGYAKSSEIAKQSLATGKSVKDIVLEQKLMSEEELNEVLDIYQMTEPDIE